MMHPVVDERLSGNRKQNDTPAQALLKSYIHEAGYVYGDVKPADYPTGRAILDATGELQIAVICAMLDYCGRNYYARVEAIRPLLDSLCERNLPYTDDDIKDMLSTLVSISNPPHMLFGHGILSILRSLARPLKDKERLALCLPMLERLRTKAQSWSWYYNDGCSTFFKLLDNISDGQQETTVRILDDDWGKRVRPLFSEMDDALCKSWRVLLAHCAKARMKNTPGTRWLAKAQMLVDTLGKETFYQLAETWIGAFCQRLERPNTPLHDDNTRLLKGLIWCCVNANCASLASVLADAAIEGYRRIHGVGPRSAKLGNACLYTLKTMPVTCGAAPLEWVRLNVKQSAYRLLVEQALDEMAQREGMSREDLDELAVPTFDLELGRRCFTIGSVRGELSVDGLTVHMQWYNAKGRSLKAVPIGIRRAHKQELATLKHVSREVSCLLTKQRYLLEHLMTNQRTWSFSTWRERYLDHPFVGSVARHLIWRFVDGEHVIDGIWHNGRLVDAQEHELCLSERAVVHMWHPILCQVDEVLAWRQWLERHAVRQPFKQAHREIYPLTDAERVTRTYSNRFAAHILPHQQLSMLATAHGWYSTPILTIDDGPFIARALPEWGIRVELQLDETAHEHLTNANEVGLYHSVTTGHVCFYPLDRTRNTTRIPYSDYALTYAFRLHQRTNREPLELTSVPVCAFTEVMRDIDHFIGKVSVGIDPTWQDNGNNRPARRPQYQNNWHSYSFGDLSVSAEERKQFLSRLLPRLDIGHRCTVDGRFLRVQGDLHTYKIHFGSGNILMEPNDQYLCIVPKPSVGANSLVHTLSLPFEGDEMLSIILSKAFLLVEDTKITDVSIMRQI